MPETPDEPGELSLWDRLASLPDIDDAPVDQTWYAERSTAEPGTTGRPPADRTSLLPTPSSPSRPGRAPAGASVAPDRTTVLPTHSSPAPPGPSVTPDRTTVLPSPGPALRPPSPPGIPPGADPTLVPEPLPRPSHRERRRGSGRLRRRLLWWGVSLLFLLFVVVGIPFLAAWWLWRGVDKVDVGDTLASGGGATNYLVVGTDSRAELDPATEDVGLDIEGSRTDAIMILHLDSEGSRLLSIPRDTYVTFADGSQDRINTALGRGGPGELIATIGSNFAIPIHHYLEVDLAGFLDVVKSIGGISVDLPAAACDPTSGLDIRETGNVHLSAEQALAYVRSRTYTTFDPTLAEGLSCQQIIDSGLGTLDPTSDFGRVERQRTFLTNVLSELGSTRNPLSMFRGLRGLSDGGLRADDTMSTWDALNLGWDARGLDLGGETLQGLSGQTIGGAAVLVFDRATAEPQLAEFRD